MVMITTAIMSIVMMNFASMFKMQSKTARNITAIGGVNDLSMGIDLLLTSPQCANLGSTSFLLNHGAQATIGGSASNYTLSADTISFANGAPMLYPSPTPNPMIQPYSLAPATGSPPGIQFTALGGQTSNTFPFQMKINFTSPSGPPPLPLTKYLTAYTDFSGNVIGLCSGSGAAGLTLAPLYNGWTNITGNAPAQSGYWKDSSGTVHLQGLVTGGLCDSAAITGSNIYKAVILILPPGYRPIYATALLLSSYAGSFTCPPALAPCANYNGTERLDVAWDNTTGNFSSGQAVVRIVPPTNGICYSGAYQGQLSLSNVSFPAGD